MRVLVTGSAGHIGHALVERLLEAGHEVRSFDRAAAPRNAAWEHLPGDLRDINGVRKAVEGMDAIAHLGAIANDRRGSADDVLAVNVQGTWNLLIACVEAGVPRVVNFSSINALGAVGGHRPVVQLPLTDDYPRHPMSPYQLSKHLSEEACTSYSAKHGLVTISLRPGAVVTPEHYAHYRRTDRETLWEKNELWLYVDRRDVCDATLLALTVQGVQNDAFLLLAADSTFAIPTAELVAEHYPETPWVCDKVEFFASNPHRSLVDLTHAKEVLGWEPKHSWRTEESL